MLLRLFFLQLLALGATTIALASSDGFCKRVALNESTAAFAFADVAPENLLTLSFPRAAGVLREMTAMIEEVRAIGGDALAAVLEATQGLSPEYVIGERWRDSTRAERFTFALSMEHLRTWLQAQRLLLGPTAVDASDDSHQAVEAAYRMIHSIFTALGGLYERYADRRGLDPVRIAQFAAQDAQATEHARFVVVTKANPFLGGTGGTPLAPSDVLAMIRYVVTPATNGGLETSIEIGRYGVHVERALRQEYRAEVLKHLFRGLIHELRRERAAGRFMRLRFEVSSEFARWFRSLGLSDRNAESQGDSRVFVTTVEELAEKLGIPLAGSMP